MQARGPLMIEHRLIERMLAVIRCALEQVGQKGSIDPYFVDSAVDFIRIYADLTHHGKEENILFRALGNKDLSDKDRRIMNELIEEHAFGRETAKFLVTANTRYRNGDVSALPEVISRLKAVVEFYPKHIEKEDKVFFPASRAYFSEREDQSMLDEFREFDRKMIHKKYEAVVEGLERE